MYSIFLNLNKNLYQITYEISNHYKLISLKFGVQSKFYIHLEIVFVQKYTPRTNERWYLKSEVNIMTTVVYGTRPKERLSIKTICSVTILG